MQVRGAERRGEWIAIGTVSESKPGEAASRLRPYLGWLLEMGPGDFNSYAVFGRKELVSGAQAVLMDDARKNGYASHIAPISDPLRNKSAHVNPEDWQLIGSGTESKVGELRSHLRLFMGWLLRDGSTHENMRDLFARKGFTKEAVAIVKNNARTCKYEFNICAGESIE